MAQKYGDQFKILVTAQSPPHPPPQPFFREEVELSNTRTAYIMHTPTTLSLTSARNNFKQKFQ